MNHKSIRFIAIAGALLLSACFVVNASACCGQAQTAYYAPAYTAGYAPAYTAGYAPAYTTNYAPAYSTYYAPTAYQTNYAGGWYPGYWWNRATAPVWGSPNTYVAAYQPAYVANYGYTASYAPSYASYAPSCSSCSSCSTCASYAPSTCSSCTAGYAPACSSCGTGYVTSYAPSCSTCASPCSSCGTQEVTLRPACGCESCGSPCPSNCGCSAAPVVNQVSYVQPSGCSNCSANASPPQTYVAPPAAAPQPTPAAGVGAAQPPATDPKPNYNANRPLDVAPPAGTVQPEPGTEPNKVDPYKVEKSDTSTYLEAPKLFNPKDRTARNGSVAPVRTAVYEQPVAYRHTSTAAPRGPVSDEQARIDAIGWTSGSK